MTTFAALTILAALLTLALPARADERVLNVYNWTEYIDPAVLERFQKETGITVHYDVFDSLETLEAKLLAGHSGYDIVVPSNEPTFSRLIKVGALAEIDRARVPNWKNLDPALMRQVESSDPGNRHGAIYLWGTTGIGVNPDRVKQLAPDAPMDSWDLLFKPENAKRIAPCGITMMDSAIDVIPGVLKYLGRSPDSTDPADLAAVEHTLMGIRRYIRSFASGGALEALATGQSCLALDYSGDVIQAGARADEAKRGVSGALCRAEGGRAARLRHAGDPGGRRAQGRRPGVHRFRAAAGRDGRDHQQGALRECGAREPCDDPPRTAGRHQHLPHAGADGDVLHHRAGAAGGGAPAHPHVGPLQGRALTPLLAITGLTVRFGATVALDRLDLSVERGELFVLLGGSGSGKTTLLRAIGGFVRPETGRIVLDGVDLGALPPHRRPVNTMFQSYALFPHMSVAANIGFGLRMQGLKRADVQTRVAEMLDLVGLARVWRAAAGAALRRPAAARRTGACAGAAAGAAAAR